MEFSLTEYILTEYFANVHEISIYILIFLIIIGVVCLTLGGDCLCRGASSLALELKINPVVIGLTVVSLATSMPEMFTAFFAASKGNSDLAVGNIIGSNIGNIGLIMGITAMIYPISIQKRLILKEMPILLAATLVFTAVCYNQSIGRIDGVVLLLGLVGYLSYIVKSAKEGSSDHENDDLDEVPDALSSTIICLTLVLIGGVVLAAGADMMVASAVEVAKRLEVSQVLIGITVVAIGTSLPELGASIAAARRKQSSICAGNIVGSNLFNLLFVGGGVSVFYPLQVQTSLFQIEYPAMLMFTALLWFIFFTDRRVTRKEGAVLVCIYVTIIILSGFSQMGKYG